MLDFNLPYGRLPDFVSLPFFWVHISPKLINFYFESQIHFNTFNTFDTYFKYFFTKKDDVRLEYVSDFD